MNNADKPINPGTVQLTSAYDKVNHNNEFPGLTKREYFAGLALQGYLASNNAQTAEYIAIRSVKAADELLKQLETKKENKDECRN